MKYKKAILGGTFDHFHRGHVALLDQAFSQAEQVTIGLTTEKFYQNKLLAQTIEDYTIREESLREYLKQNNLTARAEIMKLTDIYGPALKAKTIDAIFVTEDTLEGAKKINQERQTIGFSALVIVTVPFILATDDTPITSERIRLGEIDTQGAVYADVLRKKQLLTLPDSLRETLRTPIGEVAKSIQNIIKQSPPYAITVGDIVTLSFLKENRQPDIAIIDLRTQRESLKNDELILLRSLPNIPFTNAPGTINPQITSVWTAMLKTVLSKQEKPTMLVTGEEDLLTLPAILLAPLNSLVIYGQSHVGAIVVNVTPEKKTFVKHLLSQFI